MARPSIYTKALVEAANKYITTYNSHGHAIPSVAGLSLVLNVARSTLYDWASQENKSEFSDILDRLNATQEQVLVSNGLTGEFNSNITKLALGKHGYHEKVDQSSTMNVSISNADAETL